MLDNIDREKSVSFLSHFQIMMRFVHQTEPHIFDIFTTRKNPLSSTMTGYKRYGSQGQASL